MYSFVLFCCGYIKASQFRVFAYGGTGTMALVTY